MRSAIVPAQVTTVEDKVMGSLNFTQLILLFCPIIMFGCIYALLPPTLSIVVYKIILLLIFSSFTSLLALRLKGMLILSWVQLLLTYIRRPRYYTYLKSDMYLRSAYEEAYQEDTTPIVPERAILPMKSPSPTISERLRFEKLLHESETTFHVSSKKGGLNVTIKKI